MKLDTKKWASIIRFSFKSYWFASLLGFTLVAIAIVIFWSRYVGINKILSQKWTNAIDPAITVYSFLFPIFLALYFLTKEWQNSLQKRLTVHFKLKDKYVMSCYEAYLSSESDIRTWGQQIGQQMNKGTQLSFYPYMRQEGPTTSYDPKKKDYYQSYALIIYLRFDKNGNYEYTLGKEDPKFELTNHLVWYDNNDQNPGNEVIKNFTGNLPATLQEIIEFHKNNPDA
jgi:hypothetical protein